MEVTEFELMKSQVRDSLMKEIGVQLAAVKDELKSEILEEMKAQNADGPTRKEFNDLNAALAKKLGGGHFIVTMPKRKPSTPADKRQGNVRAPFKSPLSVA